jgi:D-arabinose 1-dehydrogenase-like Zn-dependent alcohol dehydrogenase
VRTVEITKHGGPEVFKVAERADPALRPGWVRIEVAACGINFADVMARIGVYPDAPKPPCVVGYEVAGTVVGLGEGVEELEHGQRVLAGTMFGGYASQVTVSERDCVPLPERQLRAGRCHPRQLRHRMGRPRRLRLAAIRRARPDPLRRRWRRHRRHPARAALRRE